MSTAVEQPQRAVIIDDPDLHFWGDFFVQAGLYPFLRFDEFIRDPEAFVRALVDPSAPPPPSMPALRARVAARIRWHLRNTPRERVLVAGETR